MLFWTKLVLQLTYIVNTTAIFNYKVKISHLLNYNSLMLISQVCSWNTKFQNLVQLLETMLDASKLMNYTLI